MFLVCVKQGAKDGTPIFRTKIDPLDASQKVSELRSRAATLASLEMNSFNLVHGGRILRDNQTLGSYKIGPRSCVHVLPKPPEAPEPIPIDEESPDDAEAAWQQFKLSFKMAARNPSFTRFARRLAKRENLENLAAAIPGLDRDPVACAYLSRPELLLSLLNRDTFKYVKAKHPGLIEAATHLSAAIHEEKPQPGLPETANPFAFHLDDMSDDDEYDEMDMSPANQAGAIQQRGAFQPISAEQLRAALNAAQATAGIFGGMSGMGPSAPAPSTLEANTPSTAGPSGMQPQPSPGGIITQDQLAAALAAASASAGSSSAQTSENPFSFPVPPPPQPETEPNWTSEIAKMKEMGITDEGLARKALQIMGGDLQAAIELIFSGWEGMDDSMS